MTLHSCILKPKTFYFSLTRQPIRESPFHLDSSAELWLPVCSWGGCHLYVHPEYDTMTSKLCKRCSPQHQNNYMSGCTVSSPTCTDSLHAFFPDLLEMALRRPGGDGHEHSGLLSTNDMFKHSKGANCTVRAISHMRRSLSSWELWLKEVTEYCRFNSKAEQLLFCYKN